MLVEYTRAEYTPLVEVPVGAAEFLEKRSALANRPHTDRAGTGWIAPLSKSPSDPRPRTLKATGLPTCLLSDLGRTSSPAPRHQVLRAVSATDARVSFPSLTAGGAGCPIGLVAYRLVPCPCCIVNVPWILSGASMLCAVLTL